MDVGLDANGYAPVSLDKVAEFMRSRPLQMVDDRNKNPDYALWKDV